MRVYVLNRAFDYEGETTLGVFAHEADAVQAANVDCTSDEPLKRFVDVHGHLFWAESQHSSCQYYPREFEVKS